MLASKILAFLSDLNIDTPLPRGISVMNPYLDASVFDLCARFYGSYYRDDDPRTCIVGINPGRFGGGLTGIPFTDPVKLEMYCGVRNSLPKKTELSADFIYSMIAASGSVEAFYRRFYITSVCPLGFIRSGKNLNYYDDRVLIRRLEPFIITCMQKQLAFGMNRTVCFCLGEGKNFAYLSSINERYQFFDQIVPLAHPRFIMQYKRKKIADYIGAYHHAFSVCSQRGS